MKFLMFLCASLLCCLEVWAIERIGGLYYSLNEVDGVAMVVASPYGEKYIGDIVIPSRVKSGRKRFSVKGISPWAFRDCPGVMSVVVSEGVEEIGEGAFWASYEMRSISMPSTLSTIGGSAFCGCSGLCVISVDERNPVFRCEGNALIERATNVLVVGSQKVQIPNEITAIGDFAFRNHGRMLSVEIPSGVRRIGYLAFSSCKDLEKVVFSEGLKSVGRWAFYMCRKLKSVELPSSVEELDEMAFYGCGLLDKIVVPENVHTIGDATFALCSGLTEISLPKSLIFLGNGVFGDCVNLGDIYYGGADSDNIVDRIKKEMPENSVLHFANGVDYHKESKNEQEQGGEREHSICGTSDGEPVEIDSVVVYFSDGTKKTIKK